MIFLRRLWLVIFLSCVAVMAVHAQVEEEFSSALDSARQAEDNRQDSVVFSAKHIRYTTLRAMKEYTQTSMIDTTHHNFQYYNKQQLPWNPSIHLGSYGLATRDLLYEQDKSIGFQTGYHALERYLVNPDSLHYYRARARYSELYTVGFFFADQVFRAKLAQNINPRLNIGAEYHATNTDGFYQNQEYSDRKGAVFSWYESASHRYNMLANITFNTLDAAENGSIINDTLFRNTENSRGSLSEVTRLQGRVQDRPFSKWQDNSLFLRQSYYLGRVDTVNKGLPEMQIHPTNVMAHNSSVRQRRYVFFKNEDDQYGAFPVGDQRRVGDTTDVINVMNEFTYRFYLRSPSLKNEARLELGFQNDLIWYSDSLTRDFFQNSMVKGRVGYQFSDRVNLDVSVNQIVLGQQFGDFLYEATADIKASETFGFFRLGAFSQNKSPEMIFERANLTYHQWEEDFAKTRTQNLSFSYHNEKLRFSGKAEYFLINNYMYFREVDNPDFDELLLRVIEPTQYSSLNLLKLSLTQNFTFRNWHLDNIVVYQQSDAMDILATPELYTWHSLYYGNILSQVLDFRIGADVRFNTPFRTPSYAINAGQFYNDNAAIEFSTYPIVDLWVTANIKRVNLFLSYNFVNQHVYPNGFYTVRRYPMYDANLRLGVSWKFYD